MSIPEYYYICFCPCHCYQVDNNVCDASVIVELLIAYVSLKCPIFHIIFFFFFFLQIPSPRVIASWHKVLDIVTHEIGTEAKFAVLW